MARIAGLEVESLPADARRVCDRQAQRYGTAFYNHLVLARRMPIFRGFRAMWDGLEESGLLAPKLADLVNLHVASIVGCGL